MAASGAWVARYQVRQNLKIDAANCNCFTLVIDIPLFSQEKV